MTNNSSPSRALRCKSIYSSSLDDIPALLNNNQSQKEATDNASAAENQKNTEKDQLNNPEERASILYSSEPMTTIPSVDEVPTSETESSFPVRDSIDDEKPADTSNEDVGNNNSCFEMKATQSIDDNVDTEEKKETDDDIRNLDSLVNGTRSDIIKQFTPSYYIVDKSKSCGEPRLFDETTEEEGVKLILESLSNEEKELMIDPTMPMRHFRQEKGDVPSAIQKLKNAIAWHQSFEVQTITGCYYQSHDNDVESATASQNMKRILREENDTGKVYVRGYDLNGRAVIYLRPGMENTKNEKNQMRHLVYNCERAIACTAKNGFEKFVIVMDYTGFKISNAPSISTTKETIRILQNYYPERLFRAYICNPPLVFRTFWGMIKMFVDPVTKSKIAFCVGKNGKKIVEENFDISTVERCAFGTSDLKVFDSDEYLNAPFNTTFGEF